MLCVFIWNSDKIVDSFLIFSSTGDIFLVNFFALVGCDLCFYAAYIDFWSYFPS